MSFFVFFFLFVLRNFSTWGIAKRTEDESRKEKVDPSHDDGLGHDVHDVLLHAVHHGLDVGWVGHKVALGFVVANGILKVRALLEGLAQVGLARLEGLLGQVAAVRTQNRGALKGLTTKYK